MLLTTRREGASVQPKAVILLTDLRPTVNQRHGLHSPRIGYVTEPDGVANFLFLGIMARLCVSCGEDMGNHCLRNRMRSGVSERRLNANFRQYIKCIHNVLTGRGMKPREVESRDWRTGERTFWRWVRCLHHSRWVSLHVETAGYSISEIDNFEGTTVYSAISLEEGWIWHKSRLLSLAMAR